MMSRHVVSFFLVLLVAACNPRSSAIDTAWHDADGYRWRELDVPRGNLTPGFTSLPPSTTGISFSNMVSDSSLAHNRLLAQGAGVCLADVDGDGPPDALPPRTQLPIGLYRNLGDWRFEASTAAAGLAAPDRHRRR